LLLHNGLKDRALTLAARNVRVFSREPADFVVTNAAGCGAALRQYGDLLLQSREAPQAAALAKKSRDVSQVLALNPLRPPLRRIDAKVAYHEACHLAHGQQVTAEPLEILAQVPGLKLVQLNEAQVCCGSAGSYNITEPLMAERLGSRKAAHVLESGADIVAAGNAGCVVQILSALEGSPAEAGGRRPLPQVMHTVELLDMALSGGGSPVPKGSRLDTTTTTSQP
jgi:glycolate oxidase iron-sulfur subunit